MREHGASPPPFPAAWCLAAPRQLLRVAAPDTIEQYDPERVSGYPAWIGATMTVQEHKQRLLDLEKRLSRHFSDEREQAREQVLDSPRDAGDDSVTDEDESVDVAIAELDTTTLEHICDALQRIEDGTF